jgi:two-component system, LuxR family, sensor kinase FixL
VTERRQADEAVREREATLQAVINASPDIITILDADGGIRSMSPAVHRILGRPVEERVGRSAFGSDRHCCIRGYRVEAATLLA